MTTAPMPLVQVQSPSRIHFIIQRVMCGAVVLFLASSSFSIAVNSMSLGLMGITWVLHIALQVLVTLGAVGFAAVLAAFVQIVGTEWKIYSRARDHWLRGSIALGALSVFVGLQTAGPTERTFGDQEVVIVFWISVGMALAVGNMPAAAREV